MPQSAGKRLKQAIKAEQPLQIAGVINAYCALLAERAGFKALYISGAGVANAGFGMPDLGITNLSDVVYEVSRICAVTSLPVLVDIDTGWGSEFIIARAVRELIRAGAAGVHIEDQAGVKRCGHRPDKTLASIEEMVARIHAAIAAKTDNDFFIIARTDAHENEGMNGVLQRLHAYLDAGADAVFPEALADLSQYKIVCGTLDAPVLANITEFGRTPLFPLSELKKAGVGIALYPLTAFRAMSQAAMDVYTTLRQKGSQVDCVSEMQTREELYDILNYYDYENKI